MLALMVSGIMLSRHVFRFLSITGGMSFSRTLHLLAAYWGFVLMALHLGLHWSMIMGMVKKAAGTSVSTKTGVIALRATAMLIAMYGIYAFAKHDIVSYLFLRKLFVFFDYDQSAISFFADYLAMMGLCVFLAHYGTKLTRKLSSGKGMRKEEKT
jgi:hypothetical protein